MGEVVWPWHVQITDGHIIPRTGLLHLQSHVISVRNSSKTRSEYSMMIHMYINCQPMVIYNYANQRF